MLVQPLPSDVAPQPQIATAVGGHRAVRCVLCIPLRGMESLNAIV